MTDELSPEFRRIREELIAEYGPVLGAQRASLGADRLMRFTEGQGKLQAMALFLVMSVASAPQVGYSDAVLATIRQDAKDLREAAAEWAKMCIELTGYWRAQREEWDRRG